MSPRQRVLLVDDEVALQRTVATLLRGGGYEVVISATGHDALRQADDASPDLVVLDLGLPDLDGLEVCRRLRAMLPVPIIVLSARTTEAEKVAALDLGADDYVTKPFGMDELLARLRTALRHGRRPAAAEHRIIRTESLELDFDARLARRDGDAVHLTPTEWRLLDALTRQPGTLVRQADLLREVWGPAYGRETNYLRVYLAQLRRKLEPEPSHPQHLITEPGVGHRFIP
jgi:two-component system KDP operon response regulator KdpE